MTWKYTKSCFSIKKLISSRACRAPVHWSKYTTAVAFLFFAFIPCWDSRGLQGKIPLESREQHLCTEECLKASFWGLFKTNFGNLITLEIKLFFFKTKVLDSNILLCFWGFKFFLSVNGPPNYKYNSIPLMKYEWNVSMYK